MKETDKVSREGKLLAGDLIQMEQFPRGGDVSVASWKRSRGRRIQAKGTARTKALGQELAWNVLGPE